MESVKNFFKRASSLALCACVAGTMLSSFNVYAEGSYDTLGEQFYDNGEVVYENYSSAGVYSGPSEDVVFEINETTTITGIWTYHWDMYSSDEWENAYIWIETAEGDDYYGPWDVEAEEGSGRQNVNWYVFPDITLEPGTYYLYDSNVSTWSYAYDTDNKGICMIRGYAGESEGNNNTVPKIAEGKNLLKNPSFEDDMEYWEDPDDLWGTDSYSTNHEPQDGNNFAWACRGATEFTYIYQDVSVKSKDEGKTAILSAMIANYDQTPHDLGRLEISFLDSKDKVLESYYQDHRNPEWGRHTIVSVVPENTVTIRVTLYAIRYVGSDDDAYFDDVTLVLTDDEVGEIVITEKKNRTTAKEGDTLYLTADNGYTDDPEDYIWTSSYDEDAVVDEDGVVTMLTDAEDGVEIFATDKETGVMGSYKINYSEDEGDGRDIETASYSFSGYSFDVPTYWGESDESYGDNVLYFFPNGDESLPILFMGRQSLEDIVDYEINGLTDEEALEIMEEFKEDLLSDDIDPTDITESEIITIAGYPAIIYGANIDLFDRNNVRIAHFMDGEYFYDLMIIEDENYDPSHLDDLDYIVASFEEED